MYRPDRNANLPRTSRGKRKPPNTGAAESAKTNRQIRASSPEPRALNTKSTAYVPFIGRTGTPVSYCRQTRLF